MNAGYYANITGRGIKVAEDRSLIPEERVRLNSLVRFQIPDFAPKAEDDLESDGWTEIDELVLDVEPGHFGVDFNYIFLIDLCLIEQELKGRYRITDLGISRFKKWRVQFHFQKEYDRISNLEPRPRGIEFEKLVTGILKFAGWEAEHDVQTSFEQMDVVNPQRA